MKNTDWTLVIVTDSGRHVPHYTSASRRECVRVMAAHRLGAHERVMFYIAQGF